RRAHDRLAAYREVSWVQKKRPRLRSTDAAVEGDQLFEGAAFVELGVVEAPDHDVGHVLEPVRAQQVLRGVGREVRERILAFHSTVGEVVRPLPAERNRTVAFGAD